VSGTQADARLQRLLGGEHLASLRKRLRRSFGGAPLDQGVERIRVTGLSAEEHAALASLLGRPQRFAMSMVIDVGGVDAALRRSGVADSLRHALEMLDGPIVHLAEDRLRRQTSWSAVVEGCGHAGLRDLLRGTEGAGLLKRLARQDAAAAAELCRRADAVLRRLPAAGVTRSQLAATTLGDPHALDSGRATATLVLSVLRRSAPLAHDQSDESAIRLGSDADRDGPGEVGRARDIWAAAGVLVNELARPALFLNLPGRNGSLYWPPGEPAYASLRSLLRAPPDWEVADREVYVCENPNLLAIAADALGAGCAPLVCTDGMPAAAQRCLLSQLARAGARLRYHGDFDWPGLGIGNHLMREHGAAPWRFGADDYLAAVRTAPSPAHPLAGRPVEASWDEALTPAMRDHDATIAEEAVAAVLLQDLASA
jgi:uncharacterized protein (TIGR02679 family)